jgi:flagellar protein FliS
MEKIVYSNLIKSAKAYSQVDLETDALSASPHKLIALLLEGALSAISAARQHMLNKRIEAKGRSITKAISIVNEGLKASLDLRNGGEIALHLHSLYSYIAGRLFLANLKNQPEMLDEVAGLLKQIDDAWKQISPTAGQTLPGNSPISVAA